MNNKFRNEINRIKHEIMAEVMCGELNPIVTICDHYKHEECNMYDQILEYFDYYGYNPHFVLTGNILSEGDKVLMRVTKVSRSPFSTTKPVSGVMCSGWAVLL